MPMIAELLVWPLPREIMLLLTVTCVTPERIAMPVMAPGPGVPVTVLVLALLSPKITLFEITVFVAEACEIPATMVGTAPALMSEMFEMVFPEIVELTPGSNWMPRAAVRPLELLVTAPFVVRFVIVLLLIVATAVALDAVPVWMPRT